MHFARLERAPPEISLSAGEASYAYDFKRKTGALFLLDGVR